MSSAARYLAGRPCFGSLLLLVVLFSPFASAQETAPKSPPEPETTDTSAPESAPAPAPAEKPETAKQETPKPETLAQPPTPPPAETPKAADTGGEPAEASTPAASEGAEKPPAAGAEGAAAKEGEATAKEGAKKPKSDEVQLSFANAKIDIVLKWLGEVTGKTLIKHPKVNVQLNVMSSKKLSRAEAIRLVYQALALQGIAAVESSDAIYLVPEADAGKIAPQWLDGADGDDVKGQQVVVRAFQLEHARAKSLEEKLKGVLSEKAKVQVDEDANKIIITDRADNVQLAREMVTALDVPRASDETIEIIVLQHVKPDELGTILSSIFGGGSSRRGRDERSGERPPDARSGGGRARFVPVGANRMIVTAPKERMQEIRDLITQLDTATPKDVAIRVINLKHIKAEDLGDDLGSMYRRLRYEQRSGSSINEIAAHQRSNSLIVLSSKAEYDTIVELVSSLDVPEAEEGVLKTFPLENADASDLSDQLTELYENLTSGGGRSRYYDDYYWGYRSRRRGGRGDNTQFVADRRRNAIIVLAPPEMMERIGEMIAELDAPVEGEDLVPRIIPLKYVRAYDIEDVLNTLFLKQSSERRYWDYDYQDSSQDIGRLYGKVRITSETYTNSLIVAANSEENLRAIEEVVKQLDIASPTGETTLRVPLAHARAVTIATNINVLFAQAGSGPLGQRGQQQQQQNRPQQQQGNNQEVTRGFELEESVAEQAYYPWLTSGRGEGRQTSTGRTIRTGSDLVGKVRVVPDHRTNSLLVTTNSHLFPEVMKLVEELDIPTAQVLIEAKIIEISTDDRLRFGMRFSPDGARVFDDEDFDNSIIGRGSASYTEIFSGTGLPDDLRTGIVTGDVNLDILMQFLRKNSSARIRAEPRINVSNNGLGQVFVGSRIPFIERSQLTTEGARNDTFNYIDVGITFEVSPRINLDGEVALDIRVEASQQRVGETLFGGAIIDTRDYRTDLTVSSGQTIVLGGIIQQEEIEIEYKVPLLGDIPLLGWFFKKNDSSFRDVELMVLLKPTVTRSLEEVEALRQEEMKRAYRIRGWEGEIEQATAEMEAAEAEEAAERAAEAEE